LGNREALLRLMALCRPHSVLPHVEEIDPDELVPVLRRFPSQFDVQVTEYLIWRGIEVDGLARALYMSRRALGRRFMTRGLPVPSHWLHFGRILRGSIRLQDPHANLFSIGCDLGYPDGFAFSNQMKRLTGLRPSIMRECFGWEWIVESWLFREAESGNLSPGLRRTLFPEKPLDTRNLSAAVAGSRAAQSSATMRVAEDFQEPA
jgi:AraC-like DNA-binding protein